MRALLASSLLLSLAVFVATEADARKPKRRPPPRELVVEAELIEAPRPVPGAGSMHLVSVGRFRTLKVVKGVHAHSIVLAGFDQAAGPPTEAGTRYRLALTDRFPRTASLVNPFAVEALEIGVFYCTRLERLP